MIESKTLGAAVGIQRGDVIDKTETSALPALSNGVIVGNFKRGRMDKPFKVTASNYKALLGHDPSNPSYLAVEDVFKAGVSQIGVRRVGSSAGKSGDGNGGGQTDFTTLPINISVTINNTAPEQDAFFSIEINGVVYNAAKTEDVRFLNAPELYAQVMMHGSSDGSISFSAAGGVEDLKVRLSPTAVQKSYSDRYLLGEGAIEADGTFAFILAAPA